MKSFFLLLSLLVTISLLTSPTEGLGVHSTDATLPKSRLRPQGRSDKVYYGWPERSEREGSSGESFDGGEEGEGLIYNVDYHGVSTHPSPSPKHPRPKH